MREALLVFVDGTIADDRHRLPLLGTEAFNLPENLLADGAVPGSAACLASLSCRREIVYVGARDPSLTALTRAWLSQNGFPDGEVLLGRTYEERLAFSREAAVRHAFVAGIGDRWDDSALHQELGIRSIIVREYEGDWASVGRWLGA